MSDHYKAIARRESVGVFLLRSRKRSVVVILILLLAVIVGWRFKTRAPDLQISFLQATNGHYGLVGVFWISNRLAEPVISQGGYFKKAAEKNIEPVDGDFAPPNPLIIRAKTAQTFATVIPTNGGPYRLFMPARPARSMTDPHYASSLSQRVARWLIALTKPRLTTRWRLLGCSLSVSEPFDAKRAVNDF